MSDAEFQTFVTRIRNALGCGRDLANDYARAIGENPETELGMVLVRDAAGRIIARLPESVLAQAPLQKI